LPKPEVTDGRPPFVVVVDVGYSIELFSDFDAHGGEYVPFPDPSTFRILLKDLLRPEIRERLRAVWTDPLSAGPQPPQCQGDARDRQPLGELARASKGSTRPKTVSSFLMRCLFTMFSEDVDLLPMAASRNCLAT
jgi:hypothetical protein